MVRNGNADVWKCGSVAKESPTEFPVIGADRASFPEPLQVVLLLPPITVFNHLSWTHYGHVVTLLFHLHASASGKESTVLTLHMTVKNSARALRGLLGTRASCYLPKVLYCLWSCFFPKVARCRERGRHSCHAFSPLS